MKQQDMDCEVFDKIIDRYNNAGLRVSLQGEGEPVLSRNIWYMVDRVIETGNIPYTITNAGYTFTSRLRRIIPASFPRLGVSLDTINPAFAEEIGRHNLPKVLHNIELLAKLMGPDRLDIYTVDLKPEQTQKVADYLADRGLNNHIVQPLQTKADYSHRYADDQQSQAYPYHFHCSYIDHDKMRYYDIDGTEMPCCFIKDTSIYQSINDIREQLSNHIVPTCCMGCRYLYEEVTELDDINLN